MTNDVRTPPGGIVQFNVTVAPLTDASSTMAENLEGLNRPVWSGAAGDSTRGVREASGQPPGWNGAADGAMHRHGIVAEMLGPGTIPKAVSVAAVGEADGAAGGCPPPHAAPQRDTTANRTISRRFMTSLSRLEAVVDGEEPESRWGATDGSS